MKNYFFYIITAGSLGVAVGCAGGKGTGKTPKAEHREEKEKEGESKKKATSKSGTKITKDKKKEAQKKGTELAGISKDDDGGEVKTGQETTRIRGKSKTTSTIQTFKRAKKISREDIAKIKLSLYGLTLNSKPTKDDEKIIFYTFGEKDESQIYGRKFNLNGKKYNSSCKTYKGLTLKAIGPELRNHKYLLEYKFVEKKLLKEKILTSPIDSISDIIGTALNIKNKEKFWKTEPKESRETILFFPAENPYPMIYFSSYVFTKKSKKNYWLIYRIKVNISGKVYHSPAYLCPLPFEKIK